MQRPLRNATHSRTSSLVLAFLAFLSACGNPHGSGEPRTNRDIKSLTVCDLFKDLLLHRGKTISVTGIYWHGLRQTCAKPFVTGPKTWPTVLDLVDSEFPTQSDPPVQFTTDQESWNTFQKLVLREATAGRREEIWVTIVGVLRTQPAYIREDGSVVGGYGHLGVLPAQLVVARIANTTIKPIPTYDYSEMLFTGKGLWQEK